MAYRITWLSDVPNHRNKRLVTLAYPVRRKAPSFRVRRMSTLLTTQSIWGYISHAAAKSAVGISLSEFQTVHNRAGGFFMRQAQQHLNGGLCGGAERLAGCLDR